MKFYWRTEEVLVLVCTFIKEPWSCDGGWHKTWLHPPSESVEVCSTTLLCQGFTAQDSVRICFHVWRDVQRIEQHDQQEF